MANYFSKFPVTGYNLFGNNNYTLIINILFRTGLRKVIQNYTTVYYNYILRDGDTPEDVAEKYYGTSDAWWLVLYVNDVIDPQFDWLLGARDFNKYLVSKYGSIASAMETPHHYEKIIETIDSKTGLSIERRYEVDLDDPRIDEGDPLLPYDTYDNLPNFFDVNPQGKFPDGSGVQMFITKNMVNCYDWENSQNEGKRSIKLIKKDYWPQIQQEFFNIAQTANPIMNTYLRQIKTV